MAIFIMSFDTEITADSPKYWLKLDNTSGDPVNSGSSSYAAFQIGTSAIPNSTGFAGIRAGDKAWALAHNNQSYIRGYGGSDFSNNYVWTVEVWFYWDGSTGVERSIVNMDSGSQSTTYPAYIHLNSSGQLIGKVGNGPVITNGTVPVNQWVQAALVVNGTSDYRLYMNGAQVGTTQSFGSLDASGPSMYLGYNDNNGGVNFISEAIVFDAALSATRIAAHYNATVNPNASYTATPMTSTAAMVNPAVVIGYDAVVRATPMTASGLAVQPKGAGGTTKITITPTFDGYWLKASGGWSSDTSSIYLDNVRTQHMAVNLPNITVDRLAGATLNMAISPSNATVDYQRLTNAKGQSYSATTFADLTSCYFVTSSTTPVNFTNIVAGMLSSNSNNGFSVNTTDTQSKTITAISLDVYVFAASSINVAPMTSSATMVNGTVSIGMDVNVNVTPETANALLVDPIENTQRQTSYPAEIMLGSGVMSDAHTADFTYKSEVLASTSFLAHPQFNAGTGTSPTTTPATASGVMLDGVFSNAAFVNYGASPMFGTANLVPNKEAADPMNDPYNRLLMGQTDSDDLWFRFAEASGTTIVDEIAKRFQPGQPQFGKYYGSPVLGLTGPENRSSVQFNGSTDYAVVGVSGDGTGTRTWTFEFVFKTTRETQSLAYGSELGSGPVDSFYASAIEMRDGKILVRSSTGFGYADAIQGIKNVADGQWHHVVVSNWWYDANRENDYTHGGANGLAIWIDGKLDKRADWVQMLNAGAGLVSDGLARPDVIGKPADGTTAYFQGEMSTLVARRGWQLPKYLVEQNYYAAMGVNPIRVAPVTISGAMPNARGRGNSIRVLYLDMLPISNHVGTMYDRGRLIEYRLGWSNPGDAGGFRDPITAERRLINLQTDIDASNYDLIYLPDTWNVDFLARALETSRQHASALLDDFYASVRQATRDGVNMYIDSAEIARGLGYIGNYMERSVNFETKDGPQYAQFRPGWGQLGTNLTGQYDYWGWFNNPWRDGNPYQYQDTHFTSGERIVATEKNLTDVPGYTLAEQFKYVDPNPFHLGGFQYGLRYDENPSGLKLEQELLFNGPVNNSELGATQYPIVSVPASEVKVGHVIAKEMAKDWIEDQRPDNPYADNATTIIIKEGDLIDGQPTKGRVFMSFNNAWFAPETISMGIPDPGETAEKKKWQISTHYGSGNYIQIDETGQVTGVTGPIDSTQNAANAPTVPKRLGTWFVYQPDGQAWKTVRNGDMGYRGYRWLVSNRITVDENDAVISATVMTGSVQTPAPGTNGTRNANIGVDPMFAAAELKDRAGATLVDINIRAFPMTANAKMTDKATNIHVDPMQGSAVMLGNFEELFARGQQVTMRLDRTVNKTIIIYLRSEKK